MTESLARISARRPWFVIAIWVVLVVVGAGIAGALLDSATTTDFRLAGRYESEKAAALLEDRLRGPEKLAEIVIVQSPSLTVEDQAFRAKVETLHQIHPRPAPTVAPTASATRSRTPASRPGTNDC